MSTATVLTLPAPVPAPARYSRWRLWLGVLGRTWLWFLAGSLLITFVPMLFGWRPYVVQTGSMAPRISVGDVVLAAPTDMTSKDLVGHVIVFHDTDSGHVTSHRAVAVTDDGQLTTKGDANPTNDPRPVPRDQVIGLGRLLVQFVGLPLVWAREGAWLLLALFGASLMLAGWAVGRDHEEPLPDEPDDGGGGPPVPLPSTGPATPTPTTIAASTPPPALRVRGGWWAHPLLVRLVVLGAAMGLCLAGPMTVAAFSATTSNTANAWSTANLNYTTEANALSPYLYWKLDETTGTTAADASGNGRTGTYLTDGSTTYFTRGVTGALTTDTPNSAVTLNNAASCLATTSTTAINAPQVFTLVAWFKAATTYTSGGKLLGFEKPRTGVAAPSTGTYDRHLYMDGSGYVWFGVYNNADVALRSTTTLNNGAWHMVVGMQSAAGMVLFVDGVQVATNTNTTAEATTGWWRAGCGNLAGWGNEWGGGNNPGTTSTTPANRPFLASLDEITVYNTALTAAQVSLLYYAR